MVTGSQLNIILDSYRTKPINDSKLIDYIDAIEDVIHGADKKTDGVDTYCRITKEICDVVDGIYELNKSSKSVKNIPPQLKSRINNLKMEKDQLELMLVEKIDFADVIEREILKRYDKDIPEPVVSVKLVFDKLKGMKKMSDLKYMLADTSYFFQQMSNAFTGINDEVKSGEYYRQIEKQMVDKRRDISGVI
jgi:hypothetical protein